MREGASMRKTAISSGVIGLILLIAGALMAWWITPSYIARMPGNYDKTRTYDATIRTLFNPAALASGNLAGAIKVNVPATITETVKVQQTSGNTALVQDTRKITVSGSLVGETVSPYAVDRQSLEATSSHPSSWSVIPAKGLTVSWPLGAKQQNYTGWVYQTYTTTTLKYVKEAQQGGINTYVYQATVPPTPIKNTQLLASLPKSLPVSLLPAMRASGLISAGNLASLSKLFPGAASIPLGYTYQANDTYYVAPGTGLVVNLSNNETEMAGIALPNGTLIPVLPVLSYTYHASSASLSAAVNDANSGSSTITTWGVTVPITAAAVGFVLVVLGVFLWMRGGSRGRPTETAHPERHPAPAGGVS
jgi:Porin PorA